MIYAKSYYKRPLKLHMHFSELEQSRGCVTLRMGEPGEAWGRVRSRETDGVVASLARGPRLTSG